MRQSDQARTQCENAAVASDREVRLQRVDKNLTTMHAAFSLCQEKLLRSNSICWPLSHPYRKHDKQIILTQGAYFRPNPLNNLDTKDRDNLVVLLEYWREPLQIIMAHIAGAPNEDIVQNKST